MLDGVAKITVDDNVHEVDTEIIHAAVASSVHTVTVHPNDLRRLTRLHARNEGAVQVAQAAVNAANAAQQALQQAVVEACEDQGVRIPPESAADINWQTGEVTITPPR